jgi:hypothetical protein
MRSGRLYLELTSRFVRRPPRPGAAPVKGKLSRLWYRSRGSDDWQEVFPSRNLWRIPMDAMDIRFGDGMLQGKLRIRALAGADCGMSGNEEADILCTVRFDEIFFKKG